MIYNEIHVYPKRVEGVKGTGDRLQRSFQSPAAAHALIATGPSFNKSVDYPNAHPYIQPHG
jgi:hypothetical protein